MRRRRRRRGCMPQLLKSIVIGLALILAILGTMSLLDSTNTTDKPLEIITITNAPVIEAPLISVNPYNNKSTNVDEDSYKQEQLVENDPRSTQEIESEPTGKPVLEGEKIADEIETEPESIKYGILKLSAINPENKEKLNANYVVYNKDDVKVAESSNADNTSYKLTVGKYKVVITLTQSNENSNHSSPVVQKSQYITVREYITSEQVFELEPPTSIGILQVPAVSATDNNQAMRTKFIIQKEKFEQERLAAEKAKKERIEAERLEAERQEEYKLEQEKLEKVRLAAEKAEIERLEVERLEVERLKKEKIEQERLEQERLTAEKVKKERIEAERQEEYKLEQVKVKVTNDIGNQDTQILEEVNDILKNDNGDRDTKRLKELMDRLNNDVSDQDTQKLKEVKNDNSPNAIVRIFARNELDNQPLKSNIYIQTSTGKHLDKITYVDNAKFNLAPGVYKIAVRSKNRKNMVKTIRVSANKHIYETFLLKEPLKVLAIKKPKNFNKVKDIAKNDIGDQDIKKIEELKNNNSPNAIVRIIARNKLDNQLLKSNIYIQTSTGKHLDKKIYVDNAKFNLVPGVYKITVRSKNRKDMVKTIRVSAKKDIYETFFLKELLKALPIKKPQ